MDTSSNHSTLQIEITKVRDGVPDTVKDVVAKEEPLEIRLCFGSNARRQEKSLSVTMRTPGDDLDLTTGFLFTEGIITSCNDILSINQYNADKSEGLKIELSTDVTLENTYQLERNFFANSSCGVCGKTSTEAIIKTRKLAVSASELMVKSEILCTLGRTLRNHQELFDITGGIHGCGIFDTEGTLVLFREDVGRHNALDKLIGAALGRDMLPLSNYVLLLSGRASFELIQKAWMAGIQVIAAVGAPSSLAVRMAQEKGITLIGFLKEKSFNIYSGENRVAIHPSYIDQETIA